MRELCKTVQKQLFEKTGIEFVFFLSKEKQLRKQQLKTFVKGKFRLASPVECVKYCFDLKDDLTIFQN